MGLQYIVIIDDLSSELHHGFSHKYSLKVEEYFDVFRCQCDAWSSLGQTSSRAATVATGCKFAAIMDMIEILKESVNRLVVPKCHAWSSFVTELIFAVDTSFLCQNPKGNYLLGLILFLQI